MNNTEKRFDRWEIHQEGCAFKKMGKWTFYACNMNCKNVFEGQLSISIHQAIAEERERVVGYITDEEKLLKISKNGAEEVIMNLRTRISSLDKLTE